MPPTLKQDSATILSLNYLSAIESRLGISWGVNNQPICLPDHLDAAALKGLKADLDDILKGVSASNARNATEEYGRDHIQTVGFGLAPDFDQFVKLGFLYGERVVLWDFLSNRLLLEKSKITNLTLAKTACDILMLKPAVERGAIVILPHPMEWSGLAEKVAEDLKRQGSRSAAVFGLSMALSAVEEGLNLHPFTMLRSDPQPKASYGLSEHEGDLYSKENYIFQKALSGMLNNQEFAYLQNVSAAEFQRIVAEHKDLRRKLRKLFNPPPGLSQQQLATELKSMESDFADLINKQNSGIRKYGAEGLEATAVLTTSLLTKLHAATLGTTAIADICVRLAIAMRKWFNTPEKNTIVQAFQALQRQEGRELVNELRQQENRPGIAASLQADDDSSIQPASGADQEFEDARHAFWDSGDWTENKHDYILSLPVELAGKILRSLTSGERWGLVNFRRFQETYITEYLGDIWKFNRSAFWKHIETMFKSSEGLIIGECDEHVEIMCRENMPKYAWMSLLKRLLATHIYGPLGVVEDGYYRELFTQIVLFQTTKAIAKKKRQLEFRTWFRTLKSKDRDALLLFLRLTFNNKVPGWVRRQPAAQRSTYAKVDHSDLEIK